MIIDSSIATNKTEILIDKYAQLLNNGIPASKILVLVQNSNLKENFIEKTLEKLKIESIEKLQVYSFFGLVYNTVSDNWGYLENHNPYKNTSILPNLTGLEISQFILKDILKEVSFKGYNSKKSLLHQLFRRYALIVQNNLSDEEVDERTKILKESFGDDAKIALKKLLGKTLELRAFDYLRQTLLFKYIYENSNYFSKIEYLILDDGDEITPICYDFISKLKLKEVFIAYDKSGSSRSGYLSAYKNATWELLFNEKTKTLTTNENSDAQIIFNNVINNETQELKSFSIQAPSKRLQMIDLAIKQIKELLKNNKPCEISVITPIIDDMLKFSLKENINANLIYLSGSEKLIQNKFVKSALTILKLNTELKNTICEFDIRVILSDILGINIKYCREIIEKFNETQTLIEYDFNDENFNKKYSKLLEVINNISDERLSHQAYKIYDELFNFRFATKDEINKFNFFIKQLTDFESVYGTIFTQRKTDIIIQIENSIISENPYSTLKIQDRDLIISTPQKIIDNQVKTKYQIWLDTSSDEWVKSDTGPLYNAWVFQKGWEKDDYTIEDSINLSKDKTARILRKLVLCSSEHIYAYSSLFDGNGVENFGGIEKYLKAEETEPQLQTKPIIPREDQKPVLDYKNGNMAISAVPGAGKTTILLALILKLLDNGIKPENIFVLTYMESAARNFRDRIKNIKQNSTQIPNISTIHGLALRILKENGNFERLGLDSDFEICDDTQRSRIIKEISTKLKLKVKETDEFDKGISVFKIGQGKLELTKSSKFIEFFNEYQTLLNSNNLIDYDDMLISAVKLLKENNDILKHYQEICEYIIEDEAQDSSSIQQELIRLLSGKHHNLVRCGDINQAITTTFSNADVEGFREFIKSNTGVNMNCSQRCTEDVWKLANHLVEYASTKPESKDAFFDIYMKPVENKNPIQKNAITTKIFDTPLEEKNYILKVIKNTIIDNPKTTIGILLRNNFQVARWISTINDSGLKCITRSDSLEQKSVFKAILAVMEIISTPFDNNLLAEKYEILAELGFYKPRLSLEIKSFKKPFIELNFDEINDTNLAQFHSDIIYWISLTNLSAEELVTKIGLTYFNRDIEKSNIYLISTLVKRINNGNFANTISRLKELAKKPSLSGFKFFSEEEESERDFLAGKVQIMTLHKSKGDEFDMVFLPEMTEKNLTLNIQDIKLKSSEFIENIKSSNPNYKIKTEEILKSELLAENLRLLYVAITRAKQKLFITTSKKSTAYGKTVEQEPNIIFDELFGGIHV